jgi:hypothetical protein
VSSDKDQVWQALRAINDAWVQGRPQDLRDLFHDGIVMVFPGFAGRGEGRASILAGFEDFCANARVHRFEESDRQLDVVDDVAVASFAFEMVYEREGLNYHSTGRDLWVFQRRQGTWLAVWRTMLDVREEAVDDR